ncbi:hypothetical protein B0H34DRAFT_705912 [Crassisporium funariophilum]|nr:hypothetical protein B0H34DRAFT_705912 [Crassisporium funariophilum]
MFNCKWPGKKISSDGLTENDIVIVLIGPSGVGKSTFVNTATKQQSLAVHHGLDAKKGSTNITHVECFPGDDGRRVVFVDTPAFPEPDCGSLTEREVEAKIIKWLRKTSESEKVKVAGFLYLYKITDNRATQPPRPHVEMINNLCGADSRARAVLVTTFWEKVEQNRGETRRMELAMKWKGMPNGSEVVCHNGTYESAWSVVAQLLGEDIRTQRTNRQA